MVIFGSSLEVTSCFVQCPELFYVAFDTRRKKSKSPTKSTHKKHEATKSISSLLVLMTIEPPTKSIADGHDLGSDDTIRAAFSEQSMRATTTATTTPSSWAQSDNELKQLRLQVLDYVEAEEGRQEAQQNHEVEDEKEKASQIQLAFRGILLLDHPMPT
jgi:hypothetical protein